MKHSSKSTSKQTNKKSRLNSDFDALAFNMLLEKKEKEIKKGTLKVNFNCLFVSTRSSIVLILRVIPFYTLYLLCHIFQFHYL